MASLGLWEASQGFETGKGHRLVCILEISLPLAVPWGRKARGGPSRAAGVPVSKDGVPTPVMGCSGCSWGSGKETRGKAGTKVLMRWGAWLFPERETQEVTGLSVRLC